MESKLKLTIIISVVVLIIIILASLGINYYLNLERPPETNTNTTTETNTNTNQNGSGHGFLPSGNGNDPFKPINGNGQVIPKENKLFADYYELEEIRYSTHIEPYQLPLNIKTDTLNYRDLSRKIDLDRIENILNKQAFVAIKNPFSSNVQNFSTVYDTLYQKKIPIFVTADSINHINQIVLATTFKEIEQEIFYQTIWQVTKRLYERAKFRFDQRNQGIGIGSDLLLEAARQETAYFATALELLKPSSGQIKDEGINTGLAKKYFSPNEAGFYTFKTPQELKAQVNEELSLIRKHSGSAKSPIMLYRKNYSVFSPDKNYQSSEKLKNYSIAAKYYSEFLFPLFAKGENCTSCILDVEDQKIALIASTSIAQDFYDDEALRNLWLKIYKSISFFQGLENDLTYLHYIDSLLKIFGEDFDVATIFDPQNPDFDSNAKKLQDQLLSYEIEDIEGKLSQNKNKGLKLLRSKFVVENYVFSKLAYPQVTKFLEPVTRKTNVPKTHCTYKDTKDVRCIPRPLDIISLLGSQTASEIIADEKDNLFKNYDQNLDQLKNSLSLFDIYTWQGNIYWQTLQTLKPILKKYEEGYPTFMTTTAWHKKQINTALTSRLNIRKNYTFKLSGKDNNRRGITATLIDYGYIEPVPSFYNELLATNKMLKEALIDLEIITASDPILERLDKNMEFLIKLRGITINELENKDLTIEEIEFINDFYKQYNSIIGDLNKSTRTVSLKEKTYSSKLRSDLTENINKLNLALVIYNTPQGELVIAAGPIYSYYEFGSGVASWQKEFIK